jgi:DNA-binding CsgD family transcriptional regulator
VTPAPQREQVRLLLEAGHKPREIAERLGISRHRVYQYPDALRQLGWVRPRER